MNIFVGNVSREVSDTELRVAFEKYGTVKSAVIIKDKESGDSRGFGFVEMENDSEANKAIDALNGFELKGRPINVNQARPKDDRSSNSRDGFRKKSNYRR